MLDTSTSTIWETTSPTLLHLQRRRAEITRSLSQPSNSDIILDVGCGDGYQMSYFANIASHIVGIDISRSKLKKAKRNVVENEFICASSSKLPFKSRVFDKALCLELLEHLEHPSKTIDEIDLVLKGGGILIISVPYKEQIILTQCVHCGKPTPHWGHRHTFNEHKISTILPPNYDLLKRGYIGTPASSYSLFSFLPTSLWKVFDAFTRLLPDMRSYWIINKLQKQVTNETLKRNQTPSEYANSE